MATEKVSASAKKVVYLERDDVLVLGLYNDSGDVLKQGQEVIFKTDGTIDVRDAGGELPIGNVTIGAADGERVAVRTYFQDAVNGIATDGAINAGVPVVPTGAVDSYGRPLYVAAAVSEFFVGVVIEGGLEDTEIKVGILNSPVLNVPA